MNYFITKHTWCWLMIKMAASWRQSESHCKAMMDGSHTEMGAASVNTYWVQEFGSYR